MPEKISEMPNGRRAIVWFREDLRLHDNESLTEALHSAYEVIPVFVFDERVFTGKTLYGFPKTGSIRAQFIIEAVHNLRRSLKRLGSDLIVRIGKPEQEVFNLAQDLKTSWVFCNRERTPEEVEVQDTLEQKLWSIGQELRFSRGKMLYHTGDLPFPIQHTPDSFTQFRKEVERYVPIREPLPRPQRSFNFLSTDVPNGAIPDLKDLGLPDFKADPRSTIHYQGGESEALQRLQEYLWESDQLNKYAQTKDDLTEEGRSSRFSAWLSLGCLSPKQVYSELKRYEAQRGANKSTYQLFLSLMRRDYHRFMVKKYGESVFTPGGLKGDSEVKTKIDQPQDLAKWINGETSNALVNACMLELKQSGYLSRRGRQICASYLVYDLEVNWQAGAAYFESQLVDYDVCSNWSNWNTIAGLGVDSKEEKYLNIEAQTQKYDPKGTYLRKWIKEQGLDQKQDSKKLDQDTRRTTYAAG